MIRIWRTTVAFVMIVAIGGGSPVSAQPHSGASSSIFINEFHYDDAGIDIDEAIEVAFPIGTDISSLTLTLYNGGDGTSYNTMLVSAGTVGATSNSFQLVTVNYGSNVIQNGTPDGIALSNATGLIQFLSYEGTFTAVDGPAQNITSVNIGVSENSVPEGQSLRLAGTGSTFGDFTFQAPATSSFGSVNSGQTFVPVPEPTTVLAASAAGMGLAGMIRRRRNRMRVS